MKKNPKQMIVVLLEFFTLAPFLPISEPDSRLAQPTEFKVNEMIKPQHKGGT